MKLLISTELALVLSILALISFITGFNFTLVLLFLFIIPGYLLADIFLPDMQYILKLTVGLSLGLVYSSIVTYVLSALNINLNQISIFLSILPIFLSHFYFKKNLYTNFTVKNSRANLYNFVILFLLFFSLFLRLYTIKNMEGPLFADPVMTSSIARLIVDNQKIPETWDPLLPIKLNYSPGFPSVLSWFYFFGSSFQTSALFLTNILHALFPFGVFLLADMLLKNNSQKIITLILAVISSFPTYSFVAGMNSIATVYFLLPIIAFVFLSLMRSFTIKKIILFNLLVLGGILVHSLTVFFLFVILLPVFIFYLFNKETKENIRKSMPYLGASFLLLFSFFYFDVLSDMKSSNPDNIIEQWNIQSNFINPLKRFDWFSFIEPVYFLFNNINGVWFFYLTKYSSLNYLNPLNISNLAGTTASLFFAYSVYVILKNKGTESRIILSWYLIFILLSTFQVVFQIKFPGWYYIYPSRIKFLFILPVSLILSHGFSLPIVDNIKRKKLESVPFSSIFLIIIFISSSLFLYSHLTSLAERKPISGYDLESFKFINTLPKNITILNSVSDIEAGAFVGDSGQWIFPITGRKVLFPATTIADNVNDPSIIDRIQIIEKIGSNGYKDKEFVQLLKKHNVTHIFITKSMFYSRNTIEKIELNELNMTYFKTIYMNSDVAILEIVS